MESDSVTHISQARRADVMIRALDSDKHWCEAFISMMQWSNRTIMMESNLLQVVENYKIGCEKYCGPTSWVPIITEMQRVFDKRGVGTTRVQVWLKSLLDVAQKELGVGMT